MNSSDNKSPRPKVRGSLRMRLTLALVGIVLTTTGIGMYLDYRREYQVHMAGLRSSLIEQARALQVARRYIADPARFAEYINAFCAQMNEHISPGHHILVLGSDGRVLAGARQHSGPAVERAILSAGEKEVLNVGNHRLAQVRITDDDGATIVLAQYLDHVETILRAQLLSRAATAGATALAIIVLIFLAIHFWSLRPIESLTSVAGKWSARIFSARAETSGPSEIRLLIERFNAMADELERHENRQVAEMESARRIQENLLPTSLPAMEGITIEADYRPAEQVAGDLYDVFALPDGKIAFAILDVSGHGVSAALLTGVVKMSLHRRLSEQDDIAEAISLVNRDLIECVTEGRFVTACVGIWQPGRRTWTYCAAGHPGGLLLSGGDIRRLEPTGPLIGALRDVHWSTESVALKTSDRLFLFTDGVIEAGAPANMLATSGLERVILESAGLGLSEQVETIMREVQLRTSGRPEDDVTVLAIEWTASDDTESFVQRD